MIRLKNILVYLLVLFAYSTQAKPLPLDHLDLPEVIMADVEYTFYVDAMPEIDSTEVFIQGEKLRLPVDENGQVAITYIFTEKDETLSIGVGLTSYYGEINPIPLWMSVLPPLLAIFLALIFKEVLSSLLVGILTGTMIIGVYAKGLVGIFSGFTSALVHLVDAVAPTSDGGADTGHAMIILFSTIIGGMVAVISANGGMKAIVNRISKYAKNAVGGQFATWILGIGIFFDDYANTLVVGNTMRPMTDRLGISREKLSYIVDSTAAPITAIALVSTWIGAELGYIESGLAEIANPVFENMSAYSIFLSSIKYSFYPIMALVFVLMVIFMKKDFGPMHRAEIEARKNPINGDRKEEDVEAKGAFNAIVPILVLVFGTLLSLLHTGSNGEFWSHPIDTLGKLSIVIGNADSYVALLISSTLSLITAVVLTVSQKILGLTKTMEKAMEGFKSMLTAIVILVLAWALSAITGEMKTAFYIRDLMVGNVSPGLLPFITFIASALVAFSTGSSWSTMAIVYPTILPTAFLICADAQMAEPEMLGIFFNTVSCVLAGSVMGDHCSPISDTTILSSLATSCDHISHVKTQLPYALVVGVVAVVIGTLLTGIGVPVWICYLLGFSALFIVLKMWGKEIPDPEI
jgi:Na+/H+ antiporter NhaC